MRVVWLIMAKEFQEIFRDRRRFVWMLVWSLFLMPFLSTFPFLLLFKYSEQSKMLLTVPVQGLDYAPDLAAFLEQENIALTATEDVETAIRNKEYPVGLVIPSDYQAQLTAGRSAKLVIVVDPRKTLDFASSRLSTVLDDYKDTLRLQRLQREGLSEEFLEPLVIEERKVATESEASALRSSVFIPVMVFFLVTAGIPMAVASIAGEKKAQTLEIVLFTSVNRAQFLLGKWLAVLGSILLNLFLNTLSLFIGILLLVIGVLTFLPGEEMTTTPETPSSFLVENYFILPQSLVLLLLIIVLLLIALGALLLLILSTWARNDEEAYSYMSSMSLLGFVLAVVGISSEDLVPKLWHYAIPFVGAMFSMRDLLSNRVETLSLVVMFLSTCACIGLIFSLTVWLLSREEVVFRS
ncbi:MAG: sodium ABC transporter permease NatB [Anaerolineales bacterium]